MDNELRIVQGNTFATAIEIHAVDATGHPIEDWSLDGSANIRMWYVFAGREVDITTWSIENGKVVILWPANQQRVGAYDIFVDGVFNGGQWRNAMQYQFRIVRFNHEANIPSNAIILDGIYQLSAEMAVITRMFDNRGTPSDTTPKMDGEAEVGTEERYARGDHRHPSDTNKQDVIDDLDAIRAGSQAGATAYQKPSTGIPSTEMTQAVQQSLGKADTALQPADVIDNLTSTATDKPLSAAQGKALNDNKQNTIDGSHKLSADLVDDTSTTNKFVTASEKTTWNDKQDALVSGTNIKTINNESILGNGNISIQGGEANVIESISINGTTQTITNKNVDLPVPVSVDVDTIVKVTQAAYDALATKDSSTLYLITTS